MSYQKTITPERLARMQQVIAAKQLNLTIILDHVEDPHNIHACLRTAESVGIQEVYLINKEKVFNKKEKEGKRSSGSAKKWLDVYEFFDYESCFNIVQRKYKHILGTHLSTDAKSIYETDFTESIALVLGNEQQGISSECLSFCTGNIVIPQMGMIQSLNISVACAVTLYEALRQRLGENMYGENNILSEVEKHAILEKWKMK